VRGTGQAGSVDPVLWGRGARRHMPRATVETIGKSLIASIDAFAAELRKQAKVTKSPLKRWRLARWWPWIWIRHRVGN
jgi:hypothetical protein